MMGDKAGDDLRLGLGGNWAQVALLMVINAFVGGMIGVERTVTPLVGADEFRIASTTLITAFIVSFGVVKAFSNLVAGPLADRFGRKRLLVVGWLVGLPAPFIVGWAPSWEWIVAANVLVGINQGLCWSTTALMTIDLGGPKARGRAVGLNEFAGYVSVGLTSLLSGYIAQRYGLRPAPFYLGIGYAAAGLVFSILLVRDTRRYVSLETSERFAGKGAGLSFRQVFQRVTYRDRNLFAAAQAGLVNNLNDGAGWGIFPLMFKGAGLKVAQVGVLRGVYTFVWGGLQIATGALSDRFGRKRLTVAGMWVQAAGLGLTAASRHFAPWLAAAVIIGLGKAMVYPTLIASVSDASEPSWRAQALSVYRFWRDMGYAVGALAAGVLADLFGAPFAITSIAALTFASGAVVTGLMQSRRSTAAAATI
jgi:MFS family permease